MKSKILSKIPGILHSFGNRENPCPAEFLSHEQASSFQWKQVHGTQVVELNDPAHNPGEADGFFTTEKNLPLRVLTADCVPILLAKKDGSAIAALHSGWRGTLDRFVETFFKDKKASEWVAALGPSIKPCCYEISTELENEFSKTFDGYDKKIFIPESRRIDLATLNFLELKKAGVEEIDTIEHCTYCTESPEYFSHRKRTKLNIDEGRKCQWSVIMKNS